MDVEPHITSYVGLDLLAWRQQGALVLSPKFQRRGVWSTSARSYFIDTLLRGFPVPPLHIRLRRDTKRGLVREVVDGQQRLRTLFDFIEGKYRLSPQVGEQWANKTYDRLADADRDRLQEFRFSVYQYQNVDDATVLEIFARINTYSVALNKQELRNGKYFGDFKKAVYALALRHLEFWRDSRVFSDAAIARMNEAQLVSELLIMQMDGIQDKKNSIDSFYRHLDVEWGLEERTWETKKRQVPINWIPGEESARRVDVVLDEINQVVGDMLPESEFRRVPLFYTLYSAFYHRLFGLPGFDRPSPHVPLDGDAAVRVRSTLDALSELVSEKPNLDDLSDWRRQFVLAAARQTDNIAPRQARLEILWDQADLSDK
ncbi:DUF262 domain-containing protein [Nocardioides luteus]|uniref:DUF262 domain-containing protein n=1 Tax=Nocardioides luteus TaxID=1844 RepID=UPI0018CA4584|nr:DUF262 domain-containing protein [Nocardioides luteus]MBG6098328.1 hypothetical protein [Nocardioides luteus]